MESKHNIFNTTIVQVLTQQVERVNEVDLNESKEALRTEEKKEAL